MNITEIMQQHTSNIHATKSQVFHANANGNYMTESEFNHFKENLGPVIQVPKQANHLIQVLNEAGYEAYFVGGCVRDSILQKDPHDWDIVTNAHPDEIKQVFKDYSQLHVGESHGTINIQNENEWFDVTAFRTDGEYKDGRHPENVQYVSTIQEDLARRDFTVNAIAFANDCFIDPFGGRKDLKHHVLCCVGNPIERFSEDALRILRMYRFAVQLNFLIDHNTYTAAKQCLKNNALDHISPERKANELEKLLSHQDLPILLAASDEQLFHEFISCIIPEWKDMKLDQRNPHHVYTVGEHTRQALISLPKDADYITKLAVLLHDIAKPICVETAEDGTNHFYGHAQKSAELADEILTRLHFDNKTKNAVVELVEQHEFLISREPSQKQAKKLYITFHENDEQMKRFFQVVSADVSGQSPKFMREKLNTIHQFQECYEQMKSQDQCFKLSDLKITGNDLINELHLKPGKEIGRILNTLLDAVITEQIPNNKEILLETANDMLPQEKEEDLAR